MIGKFLTYLEVERNYSALTVDAYRKDLLHFCDYVERDWETFNPREVAEHEIKAWLIAQLDEGLTPRTVRRRLSALKSLYKFLLRIGFTETDPTARIIAPKVNKPLPVFYKESEMQRAQEMSQWADDFESVRDSLIIEMLYETGMRRAELVNLDDKDVFRSEKAIRVFGKRKKERIIPIGEPLLERILLYKNYRDEQVPEGLESEAFFVTIKGKRLSVNNLYKIVRERMGDVSTQKKQSPHVLRHTFATTMLNNGADINTIKTLMGHASLAATQVYTHTTFEQIRKAYKQAHPRVTKNTKN